MKLLYKPNFLKKLENECEQYYFIFLQYLRTEKILYVIK